MDAVFGDVIVGTRCAVDRVDAKRRNEPLGSYEAFAFGQDRSRFRHIAIDLIGVEQAESPGEEPAVTAVILVIASLLALDRKLFPEDAEAGVLALADLGAERLPLAVGAPDPACIAAAISGRPERDRVDAAIGLATGSVDRTPCRLCFTTPGR